MSTKMKKRLDFQDIKRRLSISGATLGKIRPAALTGDESETDIVIHKYKTYRYSRVIFLLGFVLLFIVLLGLELGFGQFEISITDVYSIIFDRLLHWGPLETLEQTVIWDFRMPRVLTAVLVGIGLAVAGAAMQSMMKNPLADPYTTGISSGAALGATLAIAMGISLIPGVYGRVLNAFIFALIPATLILILSKYRRPSPSMMILTGIAIMYIFNAVQSYMMLITDPNSAAAVYSWTVGSITTSSWKTLPIIFAVVVIGGIGIQYLTKVLNTLNSGDSYAKSLGINVDRVRIITLVLVSFLAAGIISFTGIIGFIGLVAPHIGRMFVGSDNRILVPASALMGACLMMFSDLVMQIVSPIPLPVGLMTSIIGGPLFLILILSQKKEVW